MAVAAVGTLSTLEEEGKAAEGRRGNEERGERGNLRSDYSGEEYKEEEEGKGKYARGRQSRNGVRADGHNRVFTSKRPMPSQEGGKVQRP